MAEYDRGWASLAEEVRHRRASADPGPPPLVRFSAEDSVEIPLWYHGLEFGAVEELIDFGLSPELAHEVARWGRASQETRDLVALNAWGRALVDRLNAELGDVWQVWFRPR